MIIKRKQGQDQRPESASMLSVGADTVSSFIIFRYIPTGEEVIK